jgi:hypothetical protein
LAACGGSPTPQQPVAAAQQATATATPAPTMQIARPAEAHFTGVTLVAYGALFQPSDLKELRMTDEGPQPHSAMTVADVRCRAEDVVGTPYKVTCTNGKSSDSSDANEKWFRDRLAACFQTTVVALPPNVLHAIEASIQKGVVPAMPGARPDTTVPFVAVHVDGHFVDKPALIPIIEDECKNLPHPCDPVHRKVVGYQPPDPNAKNRESETHAFVGFGPSGYEVRPFLGLPAPLFRGVAVETIYAAPMLEGDKPDPRFVVQRYAYPPNSWEPPPKVSPEAVKETYARIVAIDPERENDATQLAIHLDRAVLAFAMQDAAPAKKHMQDLDAWLSRHPDALPKYDYAKVGIDRLHLLERGALSITDPCGVR